MTPRERLFRALEGREVDRTPVWLLFPYHPLGCYVDVRRHRDYRRVHDYSLQKGVIVLDRRGMGVPLHSAEVVCTEEEVVNAAGKARRRTMRHKDVRLQAESPGGKKLLADDADLEAFCSLPLEEDETVLAAALERQLPRYLKEREEFPLEQGAMMLDLGSPVNTLYHSADLEQYAVWSLTHAALIESWLERRMRQIEFVYRYCLDRDLADVYFLVGSELASPPMVSCATFRRWVVPYERRLIALIRSRGRKTIQHYHGQIRAVLPDFAEMGPDGLHTIESPPVGDCTLAQAFAIVRSAITLIGNIQYDEFRSATPAAMKRRVREVLDEVAGRRFILSPTAGPFDESPPPGLIDNYIAFIDAACEYPGAS
jgi:uroporphyrinogen-III decarboxylase